MSEDEVAYSGTQAPPKPRKVPPPRPQACSPKSGRPCIHTIVKDENLSVIAARYGIPLKTLEQDNPQLAPNFNVVYPGDEVKIRKA